MKRKRFMYTEFWIDKITDVTIYLLITVNIELHYIFVDIDIAIYLMFFIQIFYYLRIFNRHIVMHDRLYIYVFVCTWLFQWECKTDMDNAYRFGRTDVSCEGFSHADDPYILKGSCGVSANFKWFPCYCLRRIQRILHKFTVACSEL